MGYESFSIIFNFIDVISTPAKTKTINNQQHRLPGYASDTVGSKSLRTSWLISSIEACVQKTLQWI